MPVSRRSILCYRIQLKAPAFNQLIANVPIAACCKISRTEAANFWQWKGEYAPSANAGEFDSALVLHLQHAFVDNANTRITKRHC